MAVDPKLPISALVIALDEAKTLGRCLASIDFCDQMVVYDLGSSDGSVDAANAAGAEVRPHERVEYVEILYPSALHSLEHDWVLLTDPDEELDSRLREHIIATFPKLPETVGLVLVPRQYYFRSRALKGTNWGGTKSRALLVHRDRVHFFPLVHVTAEVEAPFETLVMSPTEGLVHHYWMTDFRAFVRKHRRYLRGEGVARYERGERVRYVDILRSPWRSFRQSFFSMRGYLDGPTGLFLSLFRAWYDTSSLLRLEQEQRRRARLGAPE